MSGSVEIPDAAAEAALVVLLDDGHNGIECKPDRVLADSVRAALVAARPYLMPTREELKDVVGQAWDDGNAMGLDGYVGPNRGAGDVDHEAERGRERMVSRVLALLNGDAS
jgi:hypothetical protein